MSVLSVNRNEVEARSFWTPAGIKATLGGRWRREPAGAAAVLRGVSIDSRTLSVGQVFVAIKGERVDGHDYLDAAAKAGAGLLIVSESFGGRVPQGTPALEVVDTVEALGQLGATWREVLRRAGVKVIAVTGSSGKTTTRHLIHTVLSSRWRGTQSPKSFNNHLGVPLTLLGASAGDDFVVAEVGMNHPGEIAPLAGMLRPDVGVITHIGSAHVGQMGSREAIAREKRCLYAGLCEGGVAVVPGDDEFREVLEEAAPAGVRVLRFGASEGSDLRLVGEVRTGEDGIAFEMGGVTVRLPMLGAHNAWNALAAAAVGRWMGMSDAEIAVALRGVSAVAMRLAVQRFGRGRGEVVVINDAYNANPESMRAALGALASHPVREGGRRVAILGDMLELGEFGPEAHREVGRFLRQQQEKIHVVGLIGKLSMFTAQELAREWPPERMSAWPGWEGLEPATVAGLVWPGDVVLLKASRGMALERLLPALGARATAEGEGQPQASAGGGT
ncbi:MAG: UDP-N-acetylmuramoyl-tripeptide--D-alanyl-D-alanine ligase [Phycisphaeraceae bacterium]|nr:UDP-N-acetylmuramoyl-tripeptide--D-alanyl-D-alanine ligase [Phycisphaeraceae bacterium]